MCGLFAISKKNIINKNLLDEVCSDLNHRGPDAKGIKIFDNGKLALLHTRLKIIDLSPNSDQPFVSPCGRWTIVYNGEIFNFNEIKKLIKDKWLWKTNSDTEVLMASWVIWGKDCLHKFVGMFSFVLFDQKLNTIYAVRDRFGIKPLYYSYEDTELILSSEIKPILKFKKKIEANLSTVRTYLELGLYDHNQNTFFNKIETLSPGSIMEFDLDKKIMKIIKWYNFIKYVPNLINHTYNDIIEECEVLLNQAVNSHLISDVSVGLNISGGVDSSMLFELASKTLKDPYLFNQNYQGYEELEWIKEFSPGYNLNIVNLNSELIFENLKDTIYSQNEPFGSLFVCGYNVLYKEAQKNNIKVLLDGNGVDEIFLGYKKYHLMHVSLFGGISHIMFLK